MMKYAVLIVGVIVTMVFLPMIEKGGPPLAISWTVEVPTPTPVFATPTPYPMGGG